MDFNVLGLGGPGSGKRPESAPAPNKGASHKTRADWWTAIRVQHIRVYGLLAAFQSR